LGILKGVKQMHSFCLACPTHQLSIYFLDPPPFQPLIAFIVVAKTDCDLLYLSLSKKRKDDGSDGTAVRINDFESTIEVSFVYLIAAMLTFYCATGAGFVMKSKVFVYFK
jgi:hypothetical protein